MATLIKQGAEARIFTLPFCNEIAKNEQCIAKERLSKTYRHPNLDKLLTEKRVHNECRILAKLYKSGVSVPQIYLVDAKRNTIYMEFIQGCSVRDWLLEEFSNKTWPKTSVDNIARIVGGLVASIHSLDVIHGDLTTSNMLISLEKHNLSDWRHANLLEKIADFVLIDFGLSYSSSLEEDKAVDLYVLERALSSTHPGSESLFEAILLVYENKCKNGPSIVQRFNKVRQRGRKRLAFG